MFLGLKEFSANNCLSSCAPLLPQVLLEYLDLLIDLLYHVLLSVFNQYLTSFFILSCLPCFEKLNDRQFLDWFLFRFNFNLCLLGIQSR